MELLRVSLGVISLASVIACAPSPSKEVEKSVEANESAKTHTEWATSEHNPSAVFKRFRIHIATDASFGGEACEALDKLSSQDLTLFEREINNPENEELLKSCKVSLLEKITQYWEEQRKSLEDSSGLNFKFDLQVLTRSFVQGYRARTGDVTTKQLVLTFDDGPHAEYTPKILDILKAVNVQGIFFPIGRNVVQLPEIVYRAVHEGHRVGSHSMGVHPYMQHAEHHLCLANSATCAKANGGVALTFEEAKEEIRAGHQAVLDAAGFVDPFFRFPFGESDPELSKYIAENQMAQFYWNIDSGDWKNRSNEEMLTDVLAQVQTQQRGIVLFHDIHRRTLEVLPAFLKAIHEMGFNVVVIHPAEDSSRTTPKLLAPTPLAP